MESMIKSINEFEKTLLLFIFILLVTYDTCYATYDCLHSSYCDSVAEAVDIINWSCSNTVSVPCGCFSGTEYREDGIIIVNLLYYGWDMGLVCNSTLYKVFGRAVDARNCPSSDPCCNSLDTNCRKMDPTAGNVHGDKSPPLKDPEKTPCENGDRSLAGKP